MRTLIAVAFVLICASPVIGASKAIAQLQLPCDAYFQVLSPDGTQLAVRCKDETIPVLSVPDGAQLRVIPKERRANSIAYSPDGRWLAVGFHDGTVELYPAQGSTPSKRWEAGPRRIDALYFFSHGKTLVVGPADEAGRVWEIADTPRLVATLPFEFGGMNACAVNPDGKTLVVAGDDTVLRWYDTASWKKTRENRDFLLETFALAFTPDGKQLLAGGADARITVLDAATAKQVRQLPTEAGSYIVSLDMLRDGRAATIYLDDAGDKPPHGLVWDLAASSSSALKPSVPPTACAIIDGKLWIGSAEGKTLTVSQYE